MELNDFDIKYRNDITKNYMLLEVYSTEVDYRSKMLVSNHIPGLLDTQMIHLDGRQQFMYDISSLQPIERVFERRKMTERDILSIIKSICNVAEYTEKYLLRTENIIWETSMMYMNLENSQISFVYNPFWEKQIHVSFHTLSAYFLERVDYSDKRSIEKAYLFNEIISKEIFTLRELQRMFTEAGDITGRQMNRADPAEEDIQENLVYSEEEEETTEQRSAGWLEKYKYLWLEKVKGYYHSIRPEAEMQLKDKDEGYSIQSDRKWSEEIGATTLMGGEPEEGIAFLSCTQGYEDIYMDTPHMIVGKLPKNVDVIVDAPSVSRIHMRCKCEDKRYYIEDLNTTNGTFLNGEKIAPYCQQEVFDGDKVRLGGVEYKIRI